MRCDVNISLLNKDLKTQGKIVEIINMLGIRFIEKAIEFEIARQSKMIKEGETIFKETRRYDVVNDITQSLRSKENDIDYQFFVDPDLP